MAVSQEKTIHISIVIVNYKTNELVLKLLNALPHQHNAEIIVVDNSPEQTLGEDIKKKYPDTKYVYSGENLGFAGGNNKGIERAKGEWVFLLNSDTMTTWDAIYELVKTTEKNNYFVSAPALGNKGIPEHNVGYFDSLLKSPANYLLARPRMIDGSNIQKPIAVDIATGAALLVRSSVFKHIGLLDDTSYFMYFEDIDFCYRLHAAGIKILYIPQAHVTHYGGGSSNKDHQQKNTNYLNGLRTYLKKHRGPLICMLNDKLKLFH